MPLVYVYMRCSLPICLYVCLVNERCSSELVNVVGEIENGYHQGNPYHNAVHAADVTQAMNCYITEQKVCSSCCIYLLVILQCVVKQCNLVLVTRQ